MIREDQLVRYLEENLEYLKSKDLQKKMSLSDNTIRATVRNINFDKEKNGFQIVHIKSKGYKIVINDNNLFQEYKKGIEDSIDVTRTEHRTNVVLYYLLQSNEYVKIDDLAERTTLSRSTLLKNLDDVEIELQKMCLKLERRRHYGLKVNGKEKNIRKAFTRFVIESNLYIEPIKEYYSFKMKLDEASSKDGLFSIIRKNNLLISDLAFNNLFEHYTVLLYRISQNNIIMINDMDRLKINKKFYDLAVEISIYTKELMNIEIPIIEVEYLALDLQSKSVTESLPDNEKHELENGIRDILNQLDNEFYTHFCDDKELISNLLLHIYPLINRMNYDFQLKNPMIDEISMGYTNVFTVTLRFVDLLQQKYNLKDLSKDEIGFITLHLASNIELNKINSINKIKRIVVICATGNGSATLLKIKLESIFSNANIIAISEHDISKFDNELPNLFLSTIPFQEEYKGIPVIHMKEFLNESELNRIKDLTALTVSKKHLHGISLEVLPLFSEKYYQVLSNGDYMEIIKNQAQLMSSDGLADESFPDHVIQRETKYPTIFLNGIATPHPICLNAVQNMIGITILEKPIIFSDKEIRLIFLINLKSDSLFLHQEIQRLILKLIDREEYRQNVLSSKTYEAFIYELKKII